MIKENIELYEEIYQKIKLSNKIIIHRHERPDPDAYGSQGGLAEIIRINFPDKKVFLVGKESPSLSFLFRTEELLEKDYKEALVIVMDTANFTRIDGKLFNRENFLIKIDHHPPKDNYGDINLVDTTVSSCSELVYDFYCYLKEKYNLLITDKAAELLYVGIVGDTGRFLFPNTTPNTMLIASELLKYNFDMSKVIDLLDITTEKMMRFRAFIFKNYSVYSDGIAYLKITKENMEEYDIGPGEVSSGVNLLRSLEGLCAWCFAIDEGNKIRVRLRSKGPIINSIAEKYDGGGHPLASGATVRSWEEFDDLLDDLEKAVREYKK